MVSDGFNSFHLVDYRFRYDSPRRQLPPALNPSLMNMGLPLRTNILSENPYGIELICFGRNIS